MGARKKEEEEEEEEVEEVEKSSYLQNDLTAILPFIRLHRGKLIN